MESATKTGDPVGNETGAPVRLGGGRAAQAEAVWPLHAHRPLAAVLRDYLALTKPRIIGLLLVTTVATMFVADPSGPSLATILWTVLGGYLAAGGAGAINHYLERDRDARMDRTARPPAGGGADRSSSRPRFRDRPRRPGDGRSWPSP